MPRLYPIFGLTAAILLFGGLWLLWKDTGLRDWASVGAVLDAMHRYARMPYGPLLMVGLFVAGGFTMFPVVVLIAATAIVFGPWIGFATALGGCLASAASLFWAGRLFGRTWVQRFGGDVINRISTKLAEHGIMTVVTVAVVPMAPFTVVNLVAGASPLRFREFMIGMLIGLTPGTFAFAQFGGGIERALNDPGPATIAAALGFGAAALSLGWIAGKVVERIDRWRKGRQK